MTADPTPDRCTNPCIACITNESHDPTPPPAPNPAATVVPSVPVDADLREHLRKLASRLANHAKGFGDVLDESDRGPWGRLVCGDIDELRAVLAVLPAPDDLERERAWRKEMQAASRGQRQRADNYAAEIERLRAELGNRSHDLNRAAMDAVRYANEAARLRADRAAVLREVEQLVRDLAHATFQPYYRSAYSTLADNISRMADEAQQPHAFVPDTPRAPGLCATCGDSRAWHRPVAGEAQQAESEPWPSVTDFAVEVWERDTWVGVTYKRKTLSEARERLASFHRRFPQASFRIVRWDETSTVVETDPEEQQP